MNLSELKTLVIPQGEVYEIFNSTIGILLWKKNRKFTVVFNPNGGTGTMSSQEFTVGELQAIQSNTFTKSGNNFYGWSLTPNGSPQYSNGQQVVGIGACEGTITLYAVWAMSLNTKYTFTSNSTFVVPMTGVYSIEMHGGGGGGGGGAYAKSYMGMKISDANGGAGGGSGQLYTTTLIKGASYSLIIGAGGTGGAGDESVGQSGQSATGETGGTGGTTKFGSLYSVAGGSGGTGGYAYAYNGRESTNGSTGASSGSLASGSSGGSTVGSYGNGGAGGSSDNSGSSGQNGAIFVTLIEYAPYTVNFDANGGSGSMKSQTFNVDEYQTLTMNAFTNSGYDFIGWSTSPTGSVMYSNGESVKNIGNSGETVTLYAIWSIPVGTQYTYTSNGTFTVPTTGVYSIEMHGRGGTGGDGWRSVDMLTKRTGGDGGGSGELYTATLKAGDSYSITISSTVTFGSLFSQSPGGNGGDASGSKGNGSQGTAVGSLAKGSSGGCTFGNYGNGGSGGYGTGSGSSGTQGAIRITFINIEA